MRGQALRLLISIHLFYNLMGVGWLNRLPRPVSYLIYMGVKIMNNFLYKYNWVMWGFVVLATVYHHFIGTGNVGS
mgnify:CR=1 FL=1